MRNKNRYTFSLILMIAGLLSFFSSCKDDFTTDASYQLEFSTDTLSFDTVFSEILTPIKTIKVYNHTSENLRIESIQLKSESNYFRINVNGRNGTSFSNTELVSGDSLYIFVQLMISELGKNAPIHILDELLFQYNGNLQKIMLSTYGQDVHILKKQIIAEDTHWTNDKPFLIYDSLIIQENATLTVDAGTVFYMHNNATVEINGQINLEGSLLNPIIFRGDRTDEVYDEMPYDRLSNQWGGIRITEKSTNNKFNNVIVRNGNFGIEIDSAAIPADSYRLIIANSQIHNTKQNGLKATNAKVYAYNTLFTNNSNGCLLLQGGDYLFNHCTIASYNKNAGFYSNAVVLADRQLYTEEPVIPLIQATFNNCIIYGSAIQEVNLYSQDGSNLNYAFSHCLIKDTRTNNAFLTDIHFIETIWSEDPAFKEINTTDLVYDFHIDEESAARNMANPDVLIKYPECKSDKDEISRLDTIPDLGAYQWVKTESESN